MAQMLGRGYPHTGGDRHTDRNTDRHTETDTQTDTQGQTDTQTDTQTYRQTGADRQRHRQRFLDFKSNAIKEEARRDRNHLFSCGPRDVFVLHHVLKLTLHGDAEEDKPVEQEDRPKDGDI